MLDARPTHFKAWLVLALIGGVVIFHLATIRPGHDWTGRAAGSLRLATYLEANEAARLSAEDRQLVHAAALVGDSPARMRLVAKGIVPQAPGAENPPDYSTLVPIPLAQGRYVRLVGKTTWSPNAHTGLAEVQVFGL